MNRRAPPTRGGLLARLTLACALGLTVSSRISANPPEASGLPNQEREQSQTALKAAAQSLQQAQSDGATEYAKELLGRAQENQNAADAACQQGQFAECKRLADETWAWARLARQKTLAARPEKNLFTVSVDKAGTTRVEVLKGDGVKVIANKKSTTVKRGEAVRVLPGQAPEIPRVVLPSPDPILPHPDSLLITSSILFHWKPLNGASRYVLLISKDLDGQEPIRQITTDGTSFLLRTNLLDGSYFWFLRALDGNGFIGRSSAPRRFSLQVKEAAGLGVKTLEKGQIEERQRP